MRCCVRTEGRSRDVSEVELTSNLPAILKAWGSKSKRMASAVRLGLRDGLRDYESHIIKQQLSGRRSATYGLNRRSGNSANSWSVKIYREGLDSVGILRSNATAWYLKLHQHYRFNGYARTGGTFAIPIHPGAKNKWPRDFGKNGLKFIKRPGKPPLLVRITDKGTKTSKAKFDIMYVLKKQIYIPKRLYIYEEFETIGKGMIRRQIINQMVKEARA